MKPITFQCTETIPLPPEAICNSIADMDNWTDFAGYGPMPGIAEANYEHRAAGWVGSRVRVRNTDGSQHTEEFVIWEHGERVAMRFSDFTPPLSRIASHFLETWSFEARGPETFVTRTFQLYPLRAPMRPVLWLISLLFRRAIAHHLRLMKENPG